PGDSIHSISQKVVQVQVVSDTLTTRARHLVSVATQRGLHGERRITGPYSTIFMGDRRPTERHDAIAYNLIDGALVAMYGVHQAFSTGRSSFLRPERRGCSWDRGRP